MAADATTVGPTPKEAADLLNMDTLLAGFRRWVTAEGCL
jgi:hypothetical protein